MQKIVIKMDLLHKTKKKNDEIFHIRITHKFLYKIHKCISNPAPLVHLDSATDHRYQYSSLAPRPPRGGIRAQRGGGEYYILLLILSQMQREKNRIHLYYN